LHIWEEEYVDLRENAEEVRERNFMTGTANQTYMRLEGHATLVGQKRNVCRDWMGKSEV
jgi:hypothetical protein